MDTRSVSSETSLDGLDTSFFADGTVIVNMSSAKDCFVASALPPGSPVAYIQFAGGVPVLQELQGKGHSAAGAGGGGAKMPTAPSAAPSLPPGSKLDASLFGPAAPPSFTPKKAESKEEEDEDDETATTMTSTTYTSVTSLSGTHPPPSFYSKYAPRVAKWRRKLTRHQRLNCIGEKRCEISGIDARQSHIAHTFPLDFTMLDFKYMRSYKFDGHRNNRYALVQRKSDRQFFCLEVGTRKNHKGKREVFHYFLNPDTVDKSMIDAATLACSEYKEKGGIEEHVIEFSGVPVTLKEDATLHFRVQCECDGVKYGSNFKILPQKYFPMPT
ncbi:MAG: hypothetical protein MRY21_07960 [Simkaniaceae bacterium]|nr:hypothetical protein [Simkaniaceae bacterium]